MKTKSKKLAKPRKQPKRNTPAKVVDHVVTASFVRKHWPDACGNDLDMFMEKFPSGIPLSTSRLSLQETDPLWLALAGRLAAKISGSKISCSCDRCTPYRELAEKKFTAIVEIIRGAMDKGE